MRRRDGLDVLLWFLVVVVAAMQLLIFARMQLQQDETIEQCMARCVR